MDDYEIVRYPIPNRRVRALLATRIHTYRRYEFADRRLTRELAEAVIDAAELLMLESEPRERLAVRLDGSGVDYDALVYEDDDEDRPRRVNVEGGRWGWVTGPGSVNPWP